MSLARIDQSVEELRDDILALFRELIRTPSCTGQEAAAQSIVSRELSKLGFEVDEFEADYAEICRHPGFTPSVLRGDTPSDEVYSGRPNVVGKLPGDGGGRSLLLYGHIDTVPEGDANKWSHPPFSGEISEGRIYGRGTADDNGGILMALATAMVLKHAGITLRGDLYVGSMIDDEVGGAGGSLANVIRGHRADAAVYCHPMWTGLQAIHRACAGALLFKVRIKGRSVHYAFGYTGVNATEKAVPIFQALQVLNEARSSTVKYPTYDPFFALADISAPYHTYLTLGMVQGKTLPGQAAGSCEVTGYMDFPPGESIDDVKAQIVECVTVASKKDPWLVDNPPEIEWDWEFAPAETPADHPLLKLMEVQVGQELGKVTTTALPVFADYRYMINYASTPTICMGPLGANMHDCDEWVDVEELFRAIAVLAKTTYEWSLAK